MTEIRTCPQCGSVFEAAPSQRKVCCSQSCAMRRRKISGRRNPRYNGGLCLRRDGRTVICCRDGTTVLFSRAVVEAALGRVLDADEIVHHINGDPTDDRRENLEVMTRAEHLQIHRPEFEERRRERSAAAQLKMRKQAA